MGRKEDRIWSEGFGRAYRIMCEGGPEALHKEARFRSITGFESRLTLTELDQATAGEQIKELTYRMVRLAMLAALHDEFGFGQKRLQKVMIAFDKLAQYMDRGWCFWADLEQELKEQTGIDAQIADGDGRLKAYYRPENEDVYTPKDLIDPTAWREQLKALGLEENDGKIMTKSGQVLGVIRNEYDRIQYSDVMIGIEYAVENLGARKP